MAEASGKAKMSQTDMKKKVEQVKFNQKIRCERRGRDASVSIRHRCGSIKYRGETNKYVQVDTRPANANFNRQDSEVEHVPTEYVRGSQKHDSRLPPDNVGPKKSASSKRLEDELPSRRSEDLRHFQQNDLTKPKTVNGPAMAMEKTESSR